MQEQEKSKSTRGGARAGSGRKPSLNPRNVRVSFCLTALAAEVLQRKADEAGVSRNDYLITLLEGMAR